MSEKQTMVFPEGFYWGAATASYQVEGGIHNTDWAKAAREGRVPECGDACDHWHRYEADFDLAQSLGHTAHRFSIEWARIEPEEGKFDQSAIAHYRKVLMALQQRNLKPYLPCGTLLYLNGSRRRVALSERMHLACLRGTQSMWFESLAICVRIFLR
jgi:hypothetical protein